MRLSLVAIVVLLAGCDQLFELGHVTPDAFIPIDGAANCQGDTTVSNGLIAWYQMESIAGDTLRDSSGNGHDGTCSTAQGTCPIQMPGKLCGGLHFDGVDDIIEIASAADLEDSPEFTVAAWLSVDAVRASCPYNKGFGSDIADSWQLCLGDDLSLELFTNNAALYSDSEHTLSPAKWFHIAILYDGTNIMIVINGSEMLVQPAVDPMFDNRPVTLGADVDGTVVSSQFAGILDDVRIYNRALSIAEIAQLAAAGS